ncbi:MAG: nicotinate (nicotinamide) nucleotide adenylyltransferase, partial [Prevotellaceae bacterium]|nr:nicotinate (nicotinamide) nucleotide adenylyltransferase [Prevotellaceae bacterium]
MRCGIYGGSFNPIHNGHLGLARSLLREGLVDEVWLMVSPLNPFKQGSMELLPDQVRLRLATLAVEGEPRIKVSDLETRLPQPSYMAVTLQRLRESFPRHEFTLVIGSDNWPRFPDWHKSEEILSHHHIIICPRPG